MTHLLNCPSPATLNPSVPTILRACCLPITGVVSRRLPSRSYWVRRLQDWPVRCLHFGGLCKTFNWHTCHHAIKGSVSLGTLNCALISIWILVCCIHSELLCSVRTSNCILPCFQERVCVFELLPGSRVHVLVFQAYRSHLQPFCAAWAHHTQGLPLNPARGSRTSEKLTRDHVTPYTHGLYACLPACVYACTHVCLAPRCARSCRQPFRCRKGKDPAGDSCKCPKDKYCKDCIWAAGNKPKEAPCTLCAKERLLHKGKCEAACPTGFEPDMTTGSAKGRVCLKVT